MKSFIVCDDDDDKALLAVIIVQFTEDCEKLIQGEIDFKNKITKRSKVEDEKKIQRPQF